MLLGENGLINRAMQAKSETSESKKQEKEDLDETEKEMNEMLGKMPQVDVNETAKENSTINGKRGAFDNPVIPKGFKAIDTETAKWKEENGYENGLVIEDDTKDQTTQGSQFVWIPVKKYSDFHLIEGYNGSKLDYVLNLASNPVREAGASKTESLPKKPYDGKNALIGTDESIEMYASVKKYGGFFIARYEAGISGTTQSTIEDDARKAIQDGSEKPVSIKGVGVWNFVPWSVSGENGTDGQYGDDRADGAVKIARSMYNNPITGSVNEATTLKSTLCYGVQWDAIMNFIDPNYLTGTCETNSMTRTGSGHGNYSGTLAVSGHNDYVHKNIYDLAGNLYEWTMEAYGTVKRVGRGGSYNVGTNSAASRRQYGATATTEWVNVGLRVALYI